MRSRTVRTIEVLNGVMIGLAILATGLLTWITFWTVSPATRDTVVWVDRGFCALFAVEFVLRWGLTGWGRWFPLRNWYDIVGMIPVAEPAVRAFRLLRIAAVLAAIAKAAHLVDRLLVWLVGTLARLVERFIDPIIDVVKRPLTVAVLDEVVDVLKTGHYSQNVARAVQENREDFRELILDKLKDDPQTSKLRYVPFHDEIVRSATDTVIRVFLEVLADPRTDEFIEDILRENVDQIRLAVRRKPRWSGFSPGERAGTAPPTVAGSTTGSPDVEVNHDGVHAPRP
jgi:voltage-gated potassium channel